MTTEKYKVKKDIFTSSKPNYYKVNQHQDLFDIFNNGLLTHNELIGFIKGNIYKYLFRYNAKGQKQSDLNKALMYIKKLKDLELTT